MSANRPVTVYISAASDLAAEREALGRTIAGLPVTLAWRIVQTPTEAQPLEREALQGADLHILVIGSDIRAPVGSEWDTVRRAGRPSVAFLKRDVPRTPAGQTFVNQSQHVTWKRFTDATDLSRQVRDVLVDHLLQNATRYALTPLEVEQLRALREGEKSAEQPEGEGADHSAVILSRERFEPSEGVLVDDSE